MKWFEKEYKERFENESTLEGIEGDALWDQINASIPQQEKSKKSAAWKWLFIVSLMIGVIGTYLFMPFENHKTHPPISESVSSTTSDVSTEENINEIKANSPSSSIEPSNSEFYQNQNAGAQREANNLDKNPTDKNLEVAPQKEKIAPTKSQALNRQLSNNQLQSKVNTTPNNISIESSQHPAYVPKNNLTSVHKVKTSYISDMDQKDILNQIVSKENKNDSSSPNDLTSEERTIENTSTKDTRSSLQIKMAARLNSNLIAEDNKIEMPLFINPNPIHQTHIPWSLRLESGATFFNVTYCDDQNPEVFADQANASRGALQLGNYTEINVAYSFRHNWSIRSGLRYSNFENELSTVFTKDTTALFGTTLRKVKRIRTVNHHNKLSTFSIPVALTYTYPISSSFRMGTSLGMSYSFIRSQQGRVLGRNETIIDFSNDNNAQFDNFFSWSIQPFVHFDMNDHWGISLNAGIATQKHSTAIAQELKQRSMMYTIGIGLTYQM